MELTEKCNFQLVMEILFDKMGQTSETSIYLLAGRLFSFLRTEDISFQFRIEAPLFFICENIQIPSARYTLRN